MGKDTDLFDVVCREMKIVIYRIDTHGHSGTRHHTMKLQSPIVRHSVNYSRSQRFQELISKMC